MSDHKAIHITISVPRDDIEKKIIKTRNLKTIRMKNLIDNMKLDEIPDTDVDTMVTEMELRIKKAFDEIHPETMKNVTIRKNNPWYNDKIKEQKRIVQCQEGAYRKYGQCHQWSAYINVRKKFMQLMRDTKTKIISGKIIKLRGDTKSLYSLVYQLTGNEKENPLHERENDEDLTNQFADYFMNKIQTIYDSLKECEKFHPGQNNDTDQLEQFEPMSEEEVRKIINSMQAKSREQDAIPTKILKVILDGVLPTLTRIINASFQQGVLAEAWKISIIHPLLKKIGVDLLAKKLPPSQ